MENIFSKIAENTVYTDTETPLTNYVLKILRMFSKQSILVIGMWKCQKKKN